MATKKNPEKKTSPLMEEASFRTFLDSEPSDISTISYFIPEIKTIQDYMSADLRICDGYSPPVSVGVGLYFHPDDGPEKLAEQLENAENKLDTLLYVVDDFVSKTKAAMRTLEVSYKSRNK